MGRTVECPEMDSLNRSNGFDDVKENHFEDFYGKGSDV